MIARRSARWQDWKNILAGRVKVRVRVRVRRGSLDGFGLGLRLGLEKARWKG